MQMEERGPKEQIRMQEMKEQKAEIRMYLQKIDNNSDSENQTMTDIMEK